MGALRRGGVYLVCSMESVKTSSAIDSLLLDFSRSAATGGSFDSNAMQLFSFFIGQGSFEPASPPLLSSKPPFRLERPVLSSPFLEPVVMDDLDISSSSTPTGWSSFCPSFPASSAFSVREWDDVADDDGTCDEVGGRGWEPSLIGADF